MTVNRYRARAWSMVATGLLIGAASFMPAQAAFGSATSHAHKAAHARKAPRTRAHVLATQRVVTRSTHTPGVLAPPVIPGLNQAYLGAWVQPGAEGHTSVAVQTELAQLGNFQAELGRPLAMVHAYQAWNFPVSNSLLNAISSTGAIPIIDWACPLGGSGLTGRDSVFTNAVVDGVYDQQITAYAQQLKAYGKPVFLRWLWEPNLGNASFYQDCIAQNPPAINAPLDGPAYAAAWIHIWNIFKGSTGVGVGANNVAFVWNPGLAGNQNSSFLSDFWPAPSGGNQYVDWIGMDGYSRTTTNPANPFFATMFTGLYNTLASCSFQNPTDSCTPGPPLLPMMIGETGTTNSMTAVDHQYNYLVETNSNSAFEGVLPFLKGGGFPQIHALSYYDGTNGNNIDLGPWTLSPVTFPGGTQPPGFTGFRQLADDPFFSFRDPG
jgi:hypothetical protein